MRKKGAVRLSDAREGASFAPIRHAIGFKPVFQYLDALVMEDHPHMRLLLIELLRRLKIERVQAVETVADAKRALSAGQFDLALVDIGLGGGNGLDFIRAVRADRLHPHRRMPMLVVSGQNDRVSVQTARDSGADGFLIKPFSSAAFTDRLTATLNARRPYAESADFFGPDRRRRSDPFYRGPERRQAMHID